MENAQLRSRYSTLLVGTDLSANAEAALRSAFTLASWLPAQRLHIAHAVYLPMLMAETGHTGHMGPSGPFTATIFEKELVQAREALARLRLPSRIRAQVTTEARIGAPARELQDIAAEIGPDLIVLASHERGRASRFIFGSVTDELIRISPCPVLVVSPERAARVPFSRILVAIDLSPVSTAVLDNGIAMSSPEGGQVWVLDAVPSQERRTIGDVKAGLERLVKETVDNQVEVHLEVRAGKPGEVIADLAREVQADLLVVGTSGHRAWERLWSGHLADDLAARAFCPVLIVPNAVQKL